MEQDDGVVKSVGRVFSILEMFDQERGPLNGTAIARRLDLPQSSAVAVLKSMVALGYLTFDKIDRCYLPTMRVTLLADWLMDMVAPGGHLLQMIQDISVATGETVALSAQTDLVIQWFHIEPGTRPLTINLRPGDRLPLLETLNGPVALSGRSDADIRRYVERINRQIRVPAQRHDPAAIFALIEGIRARGYGTGRGSAARGTAAIAWLLPPLPGGRRVVLSVAGAAHSIEAEGPQIIAIVTEHLQALTEG